MHGSAAGVAALFLIGCRTPAQVTVELSTDVPCSDAPITTLKVGRSAVEVDGRPPVLQTERCDHGRIGSVVIAPSGADDEAFALKVLLAYGSSTIESCESAERERDVAAFMGCIAVRHDLEFEPHSEIVLPLMLEMNCNGVLCGVHATCVGGACVPSGPCDDGGCPTDAGEAGDGVEDVEDVRNENRDAESEDGDAGSSEEDLDADQDADRCNVASCPDHDASETSLSDVSDAKPDTQAEVGAPDADAHDDAPDAADAAAEAEAAAPSVCGDGIKSGNEACDDGFRDDCGTCNADCTGPGDLRLHAACICQPPQNGAPLANPGEDFSADMIGCAGHVSYEDRKTLCRAVGFVPCTVDQWIARRAGQVPHHSYWTNDYLNIVYDSADGVNEGCYFSSTFGKGCFSAVHVCADVDLDPEGNSCDPRNCGRHDPTPPPDDYFGGYYGNFTAGTLCCCDASGLSCPNPFDTFSNGMFGCVGSVSWQARASLCDPGCTVCTAAQWIERRQGKAPTNNYWTNDNLKLNGTGDGMCYVSQLYGIDGAPYPMRVCASHRDGSGNECYWTDCGYADIPPPPNEYLGGCDSIYAGTLCCKP
jgi:hypothetical protein